MGSDTEDLNEVVVAQHVPVACHAQKAPWEGTSRPLQIDYHTQAASYMHSALAVSPASSVGSLAVICPSL